MNAPLTESRPIIQLARINATLAALAALLATGCTIDDDPRSRWRTTAVADDAITADDTAPDDQLELSGLGVVDIEGQVLDTDARCVELSVLVLGEGRLEPDAGRT